MKDINLLVWMTQLGLSVALPPVGFILLALWLRDSQGWGNWVVWAGIVLGFVIAFDGLRISLKTLSRISHSPKKHKDPPISFNDHQ